MKDLAPGQTIGGYEIVRHVTSGGMASLYLGRRRGAAGFQKLVAIKIVHPHLAQEKRFIGMFLDEARLMARIQHPNVVHIEELTEDQGTFLMVMEYVHGCSLYDLLKRLAQRGRSLNPALAAWIAARAAEGLHAAHELADAQGRSLNVVHRDVSPQNILLSFAGHVKLIDFGVAKSTQQQQQTRVGVLRGKIGYMSPEQANGLTLDRRTDIYALGIVLWEMLTCRRLFHSPNEVHQLDMVRAPRVAPPSAHVELPAALDEVVMDTLRPDPSLRIPTAKAFRDRLVQAMPEAVTLTAEDLANLLATVMSDKISAAALPTEELDMPALEIVPDEGFVAQHTQAAPHAKYATEELDLADIEVMEPARSSGNFVAPPKAGMPSLGSGETVDLRPRLGAGMAQAPAPPPKEGFSLAGALGTSISVAITLAALGAAGYLAYSEGWLELPAVGSVDAGVDAAIDDAGTPPDDSGLDAGTGEPE